MEYDDEDYHYEEEEEEFDMYQDVYDEDEEEGSDVIKANKKRKLWNDSLVEKNFHKIKVNKKVIGVYSTSTTPGFVIKNSITGTKCDSHHRVGSFYEHLYFKIKIATGEAGRDGVSFFFDSPEQYERHMCCEVSQDTKGLWHNKYLQAKRELC